VEGRIDLTDNRDFRHNKKSPYTQRSIFHSKQHMVLFNQTTAALSTNTFVDDYGYMTGSITSFYQDPFSGINSVSVYDSQEHKDYENSLGRTCDCCGADTTRNPFYGNLCKNCYNNLNNDQKRIPWEVGA
jgi:hypothetical protein